MLNKLKKNNIYTLQSDQYYENENNISKDDLIKKSDIIVLGAPHKAYKKLKINKNKIVIDVWGFFKKKNKDRVLLIGGTGSLGSAIINSKLFKNLSYPIKKKIEFIE